MNQRAIPLAPSRRRRHAAAAVLVLTAALITFSSRARAEEAAVRDAAAPAAPAAVKERVIVSRALSVGGVRGGEVLMLTDRGMERVSAAQLAQAREQSVARLSPIDHCVR